MYPFVYAEHSQQLLLRYLHLISSHCTVFLVGKTPLLQSSTVLSFITAAATTSKNRSCSKQLLQPLPVPRVVLDRSRHTQPTEICNGRAIIGRHTNLSPNNTNTLFVYVHNTVSSSQWYVIGVCLPFSMFWCTLASFSVGCVESSGCRTRKSCTE